MIVNLQDLLPEAANNNYAIAGFNIFSIDWARSIIKAAEELKCPVIIMLNKSMIENLAPQYSGPLLSKFAQESKTPVCLHLDHCNDFSVLQAAIDNGFSSVMYDGSNLSLEQNILNTKKVRNLTKNRGVSLEGEVGTVRYSDKPETLTNYTSPDEARLYVEKTKVDALAISIGTTHRQTFQSEGNIQYDRLLEIQDKVLTPLVIHGTSGISDTDIVKLKTYRIAKFNIGTVLRQTFTNALRDILTQNSRIFDILEINTFAYERIYYKAISILKLLL